MTTLSAGEFKAFIKEGRIEAVERTTVSGEVSFRGEEIGRTLRLLHVTFLGPVDFGEARIAGSLDLTGCWFARTLRLSNIQLDGSLTLDDVVVEAAGRTGRAGQYDWEIVAQVLEANGMNIGGSIGAKSMSVVGSADLSHSTVTGNLAMQGIEIRGQFNCSGMRIAGDYALGAQYEADTLVPTFIASGLLASNLHVAGNLMLSGIHVDDDIQLWSASVEGNLWIGLASYPNAEEYAVSQTVVRGEVHLGASRVRGHVEIQGVQIYGALRLYSSEFGLLSIDHANNNWAGDFRYCGSRLGALWLHNTKIRGQCRLPNLTVTGLGAGASRSVTFANSQIDGDVRFWMPGQFLKDGFAAEDEMHSETRGASIVGDIDFSGATIGGECNLTNLVVDGTIVLDDAVIHGDVAFQSAVSLLDGTRMAESFREMFERLVRKATEGQTEVPMATARRLSMVMMRCHNDVDLSGLSLRARKEEVESHSGYGNIDARDIEVAGHLWQFRRINPERWAAIAKSGGDKPPPTADVHIPGSADYSGSKIWHLSLSGMSFQTPLRPGDDPDRIERQRGLILASAEINILEIDPLPEPASAFPVPLNLADIKVAVWNIKENDQNRVRRYRELLASDQTFRRSTYMDIESGMRNRGHEAEADRIYRAMVRRSVREAKKRPAWIAQLRSMAIVIFPVILLAGLLQADPLVALAAVVLGALLARPLLRLAHLILWDGLLGFGTAPWRIGIIILAMFVLSTGMVYLDARNIGPSLTAQIAYESPPEHPRTWGIGDAVAIGLRNHVPLTSWDVRDEWQLSDDKGRALRIAGLEIPWLHPEDWGMLMMALNLLAWPPFLAFALRRAFRSAQ